MEPSFRFLDLIPSELLEFLVYPLNNDDLLNFIQFINSEYIVWSRVFEYHFGYRAVRKEISKDEYIIYLNIESLKEKWRDVSGMNNYTIEELFNIKKLNLNDAHIQEIPKEIGNLINLQTLSLHYNLIQEIPKEIGNLSNLEILDLYDNQISSIPKEIGNLRNLKHLYLYDNQISSIPKEIGNLRNLKELHLYYNQISSIPKEIGDLK